MNYRCIEPLCTKRGHNRYCETHAQERRAYLIEWYQTKLNFTLEKATELAEGAIR